MNGQRLTPYSKGIMTDTEKALQWVTFSIGQKPSQQGVLGDANLYSWKQLKLVIQKINGGKGYAGFHDWRIPTSTELESIIGADGTGQVFALDDPLEFWTQDSENGEAALLYGRGMDSSIAKPKAYKAAVRLVRSLSAEQMQQVSMEGFIEPIMDKADTVTRKLVDSAEEVIKNSRKLAGTVRDKGLEKIKEAGYEQKAIHATEKISKIKPVLKSKIEAASSFIKAEQDGTIIAAGEQDYSGLFGIKDKKTRNIVLLYIFMVFFSGYFLSYIGGLFFYILGLWAGGNSYTLLTAVFPFFTYEYHAISFGLMKFLVPVILIGSLFAWFKNPNGKAIAKAFKGKEVGAGNIKNEKIKRLDEMVEEMACTAGIKKPALFVIKDKSINAFAAGKSQEDAVIGVTSGLLKNFNDEEVRAVVAHEFGHILNKDVKLNMMAMAAVFGFSSIAVYAAGIWFARKLFDDGTGQGRLLGGFFFGVAAAAILITGALMAFSGFLMQKAISRHREFLADASSARLTGSTAGLISALEKIKNNDYPTAIENKMAFQYSHALIFGSKIFSIFDTHPPLQERIDRLKLQATHDD